MRIGRYLHGLCFITVLIAFSATAWTNPVWQENGVGVCTTSYIQETPNVVSLGAGGAIVVWSDNRNGNFDILARRLSTTGEPVWTDAGGQPKDVVICSASYDQQFPSAIADGVGGAIVVWQDGRSGDDGLDLYAQRIDADGNLCWPVGNVQPTGVLICQHTPSTLTLDASTAFSQVVASDGAGGAIVAWRDTRGDVLLNNIGDTEIYAQRIDSTGTVRWTTNGVGIRRFPWSTTVPSKPTSSWPTRNPTIVADGAGGALIVWQDGQNLTANGYDLQAQRVTSSGTLNWGTAPITICSQPYDQAYPEVAESGGYYFVVWEDKRLNNQYDIYMQRLDSSGAGLWTNGMALVTAANNQRTPRIIPDGSGGVIVAWTDERTTIGKPDIYAIRLNSSGSAAPGWGSGVVVCDAVSWQGRIRMAHGDAGSSLITWTDNRVDPANTTYKYDLYAQMLDASGTAQWVDDGLPIAATTNVQRLQQVTPDGSGGIYVVWEDNRKGTDYDIYAQRMTPSPTPTPVNGVADAKTQPDGKLISLPLMVVVGAFGDHFYVEEQDRSSGIKVISAETVSVGDLVSVTGTLVTSTERYVTATEVAAGGQGTVPDAVGVPVARLGASTSGLTPQVGTGYGLSNVGLLVRTWGQVVAVSPNVVIQDGDRQVKVYGATGLSPGDFAAVTGVCSSEPGDSGAIPAIRIRSSADVQAW